MKRISLLLATLFFSAAIFAQTAEESEEIQYQHEYEDSVQFIYSQNQEGDQYIRISLSPEFPMFFGNPFTDGKIKTGGMANLGYHYFFTPNLAFGIDFSFAFHPTIGGNIFNSIPILATITYQPTYKNFEFPLTLALGFAWETYGNQTYWPGFVLRPQAGVHYRINQNWSLGGDVSYTFMPQLLKLYGKANENFIGQFISLDIVARYYF
ncbi:MAG: hypothetical protein J5857_12165 [Treponema sp.]|nr:hypothetical protein [Treponema sp.]